MCANTSQPTHPHPQPHSYGDNIILLQHSYTDENKGIDLSGALQKDGSPLHEHM